MRTTPARKALKQVARGFAFLDERGPRNWREHIQVDELQMRHCNKCVLGQLYAHYWTGVSLLRLEGNALFRYGFDGTGHYTNEINHVTQISYVDLDHAVCRLLRHRHNMPQTGPPWRAANRC